MQCVVIQLRQVYFWNIFICRSYCRAMLVFIKAFTNSFFGIERSTPVSASTVYRTCLIQSGLTSQLSKSNKHGENILTFWRCCCRLKYTWTENESLGSVVFNKKCQGCCLFSKPGTRRSRRSAWKEQEFQIEKGLRWTFIHIALLSEMISSDIKLSWLFCHG